MTPDTSIYFQTTWQISWGPGSHTLAGHLQSIQTESSLMFSFVFLSLESIVTVVLIWHFGCLHTLCKKACPADLMPSMKCYSGCGLIVDIMHMRVIACACACKICMNGLWYCMCIQYCCAHVHSTLHCTYCPDYHLALSISDLVPFQCGVSWPIVLHSMHNWSYR